MMESKQISFSIPVATVFPVNGIQKIYTKKESKIIQQRSRYGREGCENLRGKMTKKETAEYERKKKPHTGGRYQLQRKFKIFQYWKRKR